MLQYTNSTFFGFAFIHLDENFLFWYGEVGIGVEMVGRVSHNRKKSQNIFHGWVGGGEGGLPVPNAKKDFAHKC